MRIGSKTALTLVVLLSVCFPVSQSAHAAEKTKAKPVVQKGGNKQQVARSEKTTKTAKKGKSVSMAKRAESTVVAKKLPARKVYVEKEAQWQGSGRLDVQSGAALVVDQEGGIPLYQKNANQTPLPRQTHIHYTAAHQKRLGHVEGTHFYLHNNSH